ncbi:MAG: ferrochelatase [Thermoplasmatales archaeon]
MTDKAVVLMYYGFPERKEEMADYLRDILHGKEPPEYLLRENLSKLEIIGGATPSTSIVRSIRDKVAAKLRDQGYSVYLLSKHYKPSINEAASIVGENIIYEVPLFPIYSNYIFEGYYGPFESSLGERKFVRISNIGFEGELLGYFADLVQGNEEYLLVFSAHSIPIERPDEYPVLIDRMSKSISGGREYINIYHSQGPFHSKWLSPYPEFSIKYAKEKGYSGIKIVPIGFIYDHLEVLYDLDYRLRNQAIDAGLDYLRVPLPNDSSCVINSIASAILRNRKI